MLGLAIHEKHIAREFHKIYSGNEFYDTLPVFSVVVVSQGVNMVLCLAVED